MRKKIAVVFLTVCLLMIGCKSSREAFLEEYITVSDEIVRMVEANPTAESVKQAQIYLDSKKSSLKSKFTAGSKEGADKTMEDKFRVILSGQTAKITKLAEKHPALKSDLDSLIKDFGTFLLKW